MSVSLALAIYFICWWVVLFAVLPLRLGREPPESERDPLAEAAGAPQAPHMFWKFIIATAVSAAIFAIVYAVIALRLLPLGTFAL